MISGHEKETFTLGYIDPKDGKHKNGLYTNHSIDTETLRFHSIYTGHAQEYQPLLSEFIEDLQKILEKHGDGYVCIDEDKHNYDYSLTEIDVYVTSLDPVYKNRRTYWL